MNKVYHTIIRVLTPKWDHPGVTCCIYCGNNIYNGNNGAPGEGGWPSVCGSCGRDLPTEEARQDEPSTL